jgi:hypothetical protein
MRFPQAEFAYQSLLETIYTVGQLFFSTVPTDPAVLLGFGVWESFGEGRVLVGHQEGDTDFGSLEGTGGAKTHTLTEAQMPSHTHIQNAHAHVQNAASTATGPNVGSTPDTSTNNSVATGYSTANTTAINQNTGGGGSHNNLQPFVVVKVWRRTA